MRLSHFKIFLFEFSLDNLKNSNKKVRKTPLIILLLVTDLLITGQNFMCFICLKTELGRSKVMVTIDYCVQKEDIF